MAKNHLAHETSPYLLQHADNPVDWYPWGEEALAKARRENKPILLSIGYSACHWCHVMAHESFSDKETAKIMNELFVNIKVDREERPDLDKIYQMTHQLLTQKTGGWPLTVFLTPDKQVPFFSGTYFPVEPRYQMPAFKEVLRYLAKFYQDNKAALEEQNQTLLATLNSLAPKAVADAALNLSPLHEAIKNISSSYDKVHGGFGDAPKFPHPIYLNLLLQDWYDSGKKNIAALQMVETTLMKMAKGGLYDQLGGGFYRYTVDAEWHIPHFEKMLYDNAQLLSLYAQTYAATTKSLFLKIARETGEWIIREMQAPEGGYYSTLDADSEGEEGKYYLWDTAEVQRLLTPEEYAIFSVYYGLTKAPNFEHKWHLQVMVEDDSQLPLGQIDAARQKLLVAREHRVYPHRDEKILTGWNGLMIKAMAEAGKFINHSIFINSAQAALDFIKNNLWINNRLYATYKDGKARFLAYLDDYVFLIEGILALLEIQWRDDDFQFALNLLENVLTHFADSDAGGFFFTADDHESLLYRPKNFMDEAIPNSNGILAFLVNRFWYITGDSRYQVAAEEVFRATWNNLAHYPEAHGSILLALTEFLIPSEIIIIRGKGKHIKEWQQIANQTYAPHRLVLVIPDTVKELPAMLADKKPMANIVAYICRGQQCLPPITDVNEFAKALKND